MARKTGVTKDTLHHIILDAGVVYLNWGSSDPLNPPMKLGATRGGSTYHVESERRDMPLDGITGIARGGARFLGVTVELTTNLVEITKEILTRAIPGATIDTGTVAVNELGEVIPTENHYTISRRLEQTIPDITYNDIAIVAEVSNTKAPIICGLKSGIAGGGLELSFADGDESVLAVTFTGTIDPLDPDEEPWFIIYPEALPTP